MPEAVVTPPADPATPPVVTPPVTPPATPPATTSWRDGIADTEHKKLAERYDTPASLTKALSELQKWQGGAIKMPAADAKPEELAAFREKLGWPKEAKDYEFARPAHLDEAAFNAEPMKAAVGKYAAAFHKAGLSKAQVSDVMAAHWAMDAESRTATVTADKQFADKADADLRKSWGADYDKNRAAANRAASHFFADKLKDAQQLETKAGRFLLDDPRMVEVFAKIGREMGEDRLGPMLSAADKQTAQQKISDIGRQKHEALQKGDRTLAARLDKEQFALIQKSQMSGPIVGSQGRAA